MVKGENVQLVRRTLLTIIPGRKMKRKPDSRPAKRASLELDTAQRALGAAIFWWNQVLAAERANEGEAVDAAAASALRKTY
jgi:hypothetical protein